MWSRLATMGLLGTLVFAIQVPIAVAEKPAFPCEVELRANQYFYIHGEKQERIDVICRSNLEQVAINNILVCSEDINDLSTLSPSSPEVEKFIEEIFARVPYVVDLLEQGVDEDTALEMCMARQDSFFALVDPLASCYMDGSCSEGDVAEQSAVILNDLGYDDVCESIATADGNLVVQLYCDMAESPWEVVGSLCPLREADVRRKLVHGQYDAESIYDFFNTTENIATICVVSANGLFHYLLGEDFVNKALLQIESAERGEDIEGPLSATFIADFKPHE